LPIFDHLKEGRGGRFDLKIGMYGIGDKSAIALGTFLRACDLDLQVLDVSYNSIHDMGMKAILDAIRCQAYLRIIDLSGNYCSHAAGLSIARMFTTNNMRHLYELNLSSCSILDESMRAIADAFVGNNALKRLLLSNNRISRSGAPIAKLIAHNATITELDLSWNNLRNADAEHVAEALGSDTVLRTLNLGWNNFGSAGPIAATALALTTNAALTKLDLSWNRVRENGCALLGDALKTNRSLRYFIMDGNPVGDEGGKRLLDKHEPAAADAAAPEDDAAAAAAKKSALLRFVSLQDCNFENYQADDGPVEFNVNDPNGQYVKRTRCCC